MVDTNWASTQLSRLLGLDDESSKQVVDYTLTLSPDAAAEHLGNLLGASPQAIEFISTFNARRNVPKQPSPGASPARAPRHTKKQKKPLNHLPPPRRPDDFGHTEGAYRKKDADDDYMPGSSKSREPSLPSSRNLSPAPSAVKKPVAATGTHAAKPPPSAAGTLISDLPNVRSRQASPNPKAKAKVSITGGTPMHGESSELNNLDSAIRSLELQTNPATANPDPAARACDCLATKHPLLAVAPNCLACGKIVCVKEGLAPCTFCSSPLLSQSQIQDMIRELRDERGRERQNLHNAGQRKAEVSMTPRPFQPARDGSPGDASLTAAQAHRDKLLNFQAQNARRTRVHDEVADFETPSSGTNMWSSPIERAQQLKRQQKVLREMEWAAKPEYEKRKVVMSVDLVGGKVVRRYGTAKAEQPAAPESNSDEVQPESAGEGAAASGAFGKNPLIGHLIKPTWAQPTGDDHATDSSSAPRTRNRWRRVQDDQDDNEELILDGGTYGSRNAATWLGAEERAVAS